MVQGVMDGLFSYVLVGLMAAVVAHLLTDTLLVSVPVFLAAFIGTAWYTAEHG